MLTLRALPSGDGNALTHAYHDGLRRHWSPASRLLARLLAAAGQGGWSRGEVALLSNAVRAQGLSMADRKGLHRLLNPAAFPAAACPLRNKPLFARQVRQAGLPAPESWFPDEEGLAGWIGRQHVIIAKPSFRSKGRGVERFRRDGDGWADRERLLARLDRMARAGGVVQEGVATHADLAPLSPGALPTLRVMTCIDEAGRVEPCDRILRLSAGGARPVDNFNAGNLVAALDVAGRCAAVWRAGAGGVEAVDRHPATGAALIGRPVPDLNAAIALAVAAHDHFRDGFTVIGWDIGLTTRGPVLIEGNWNPGTDIVQLAGGHGLSAGRLGALYRHHLAGLPVDRWRAAGVVERDRRHR